MVEANLLVLFWEGFEPIQHSCVDSQTLRIRLQAKADVVPRYSRCGRQVSLVHDVHWRQVRERDLFSCRVWLEVPVRPLRCPTCGPSRERIPWLAGRRALTVAMVRWIETRTTLLPLAHVARLLGLHWHTVKAIDHQRLCRELPAPDLSRVHRLVMDEFALHKGHRYATVVICTDTQQVLWVGEGSSRAAIRPFFE